MRVRVEELAERLEAAEAVAEGVENADQLERLREMGCDLAQGNHFSRPLAAPEAKRYLERALASTP